MIYETFDNTDVLHKKIRLTSAETIPSEMKQRAQWLVLRRSGDKNRDKVPLTPNRGFGWQDESKELFTFEEAMKRGQLLCDSSLIRDVEKIVLGFRLTSDQPFVGVDIDDLEDPADISSLLDDLDGGYAEWSVSGTGLHIILRGSLSENETGAPLDVTANTTLEAYDDKHYFTITGDVYDGRNSISRNHQKLDSLVERYTVAPIETQSATEIQEGCDNGTSVTDIGRRSARSYSGAPEAKSLTAEQAIERGLACSDADFNRLWRGDIAGYQSRSEADLSLACKLVYHCKNDRQLVDECFRQSGLYDSRSGQETPKWDEVHYSNGKTYGERTIDEALRRNRRER